MKLKSSYQLCDHHHKAWLARESISKLTCVAVDHRLWNSARGILHRTAHSVTPGFLQSELSKKGGRAKENKLGATVLFIISLRTDISSLWYSIGMHLNLDLVWEEPQKHVNSRRWDSLGALLTDWLSQYHDTCSNKCCKSQVLDQEWWGLGPNLDSLSKKLTPPKLGS